MKHNRERHVLYLCLDLDLSPLSVPDHPPPPSPCLDSYYNFYSIYILAVQEERQKNKDVDNQIDLDEPDSTMDMPIDQILEAEMLVEPKQEKYVDSTSDAVANICQVRTHAILHLLDCFNG